MITHTKKQTITLALSLLLPTLALQSMQLSNSHKKTIENIYNNKEKNINGTVLLNDVSIQTFTYPFIIPVVKVTTTFPITYATENNTNIPTKHTEPFVRAKIIDKKTNKQIQFKDGNTINIPAKIFNNTTDGSRLFLKTIKGKKYNLSLTCAKNDNLNGNNFKEQFDLCMKLFYKHAFINNDNDIETLENSNIITSDMSEVIGLINFCPFVACEPQNKHAVNGCSSEEVFVQQIIKTSSLQSGPTNIHTSLMRREYDNKGLFKQLQ